MFCSSIPSTSFSQTRFLDQKQKKGVARGGIEPSTRGFSDSPKAFYTTPNSSANRLYIIVCAKVKTATSRNIMQAKSTCEPRKSPEDMNINVELKG